MVTKSFDMLTAFLDVLGQQVSAAPANHARGEAIVDSAMDFETNASLGVSYENRLTLVDGEVAGIDVVKMAQTFRTGTSDVDAIDFVEMFLADEHETDIDALNAVYVCQTSGPPSRTRAGVWTVAWPGMTTRSACRRSFRRDCGSRITAIVYGRSTRASRRPT